MDSLKHQKKSIYNCIPVEAIQERDIDFLLLEEIKCNKDFINWFVSKILGEGIKFELLKAWHSISSDGMGQSDVVFKIDSSGKTILFLIENKLNADFQPEQANRYHTRGNSFMNRQECDEYNTILFAPQKYQSRTNGFHYHISYEDLRDWFLNQNNLGSRGLFKVEMLNAAIEKLRRGYTPIINDAATKFRWEYYNYANEKYPKLKMSRPKNELPRKTGFMRFKPLDAYLLKQEFIIHKQFGTVDLQLRRFENNLELFKQKFQQTFTKEMKPVITGKSVSLRIEVPQINIVRDFEEQKPKIEIALQKAIVLYNWAMRNLK